MEKSTIGTVMGFWQLSCVHEKRCFATSYTAPVTQTQISISSAGRSAQSADGGSTSVTNNYSNRYCWDGKYGVATYTVALRELCQQLCSSVLLRIVATRCQILRLKCTKFDFGWALPQTLLGSLQATALYQTPSWI